MATPQPAIFAQMGKNQWYVHLSRTEGADLDRITQYKARTALKGNMAVARETPTFIYGASLDMTGFIDGTGNPQGEAAERAAAIVPDR